MLYKRIVLLGLFGLIVACAEPAGIKTNKAEVEEHNLRGYAQGSTFQIKFRSDVKHSFRNSFDSIFKSIDASMSTYLTSSSISRLNAGEPIWPDTNFIKVLRHSITVAEQTGGLFDPTIGPLVSFWGFGTSKKSTADTTKVDSVKALVDYRRLPTIEEDSLVLPVHFSLDFNSIAQGYTVDVLAEFLEQKGVKNFMVEVGGEVRTQGVNARGEAWRIGIDKPSEEQQEGFQIIVSLADKSLATSGNYRKFWVDELTGIKYAHTIEPISGWPAKNTLLSATIIANYCMDADAYATSCMVMGLKKSVAFIENLKGVEGYFVYSDSAGNWQTIHTTGFKEYLPKL